MKFSFPWGGGLGCWGVKFKSGFYFDIFHFYSWRELKRFKPGVFIMNPNRKPGSWSCKYCGSRVSCLTWPRCYKPRTWWFPLTGYVKVGY